MATLRILKRHVGRSLDFTLASIGWETANGVIESVKNGIAAIRYYHARDLEGREVYRQEGFVTYLPVRCERIVAIY